MNECKWIIFRRCGYDKEQSIKYWEIIYKRCKAHTWGKNWTVDQINEFKKYIDMLLPFRESDILDVIKEVFGEVEVIKHVRFDTKI
jgi:hypothetical protein